MKRTNGEGSKVEVDRECRNVLSAGRKPLKMK
jgi:hypothetical protein